MIYTLKPDKAGEIEILHRNGKQLFCPFKPTMILPGQLQGQAILHREPCGTWCALFTKQEEAKAVSLLCTEADYVLTDESQPEPGKLIKL